MGADGEAPAGQYTQFWSQFGKAMKLGVIEDSGNKQRLAKLVRFHSTNDPEKLTSLDAYISRMPESQKEIYYLAGATSRPAVCLLLAACCLLLAACSWLQCCLLRDQLPGNSAASGLCKQAVLLDAGHRVAERTVPLQPMHALDAVLSRQAAHPDSLITLSEHWWLVQERSRPGHPS